MENLDCAAKPVAHAAGLEPWTVGSTEMAGNVEQLGKRDFMETVQINGSDILWF